MVGRSPALLILLIVTLVPAPAQTRMKVSVHDLDPGMPSGPDPVLEHVFPFHHRREHLRILVNRQ